MSELNSSNNHSPVTNEVIAVQLISGITVLGKVVPTDPGSDALTLKKPMSLIVQPNAQGSLAVSMMPFLSMGVFPALEEIEFEQHHILMVRSAPTQLVKLYMEMSSGLAIAGAGTRF